MEALIKELRDELRRLREATEEALWSVAYEAPGKRRRLTVERYSENGGRYGVRGSQT